MSSLLRIDPRDDVATALVGLQGPLVVEGWPVNGDIPAGHKVALRKVLKGEPVLKYGWPIGHARVDIEAGDHVHSHNLATNLSGLEEYRYLPSVAADMLGEDLTFDGYRRADGRVGTRNEIWILCTVGCVARTAQKIAAAASERFAGRVDGVHALTHPFGCSQLGDDLAATKTMIAALASHPNAGGVLIVGLGCESNQLAPLLESLDGVDPARLRAFSAQLSEDEIEEGIAAVEALVAVAEHDSRVPCPASDLVIGLKCGGSDGLSGLTANPLVGRIADKVTGAGGAAILTEIPEIFGAERLLMARAADQSVFDGVVRVVNDFKTYFLSHGEPISENPSPGNLAGGVTTLEEKSLGAVQKAGRGQVTQVLRYGQRTDRPGVVLLEAPGNDAVSSTALTLKIATNSSLAQRKPRWIDFDAGPLATGLDMDTAADALMATVLATASGRPTRAEENGEREIALWKRGVTL